MNGDSRYIDERPGSWEMERLEEAGERMRARAWSRVDYWKLLKAQNRKASEATQDAEETKEGE